ncbi:hypothetical protein FA13DRAFT_774310 [Coprinellus micaceus]|uniref:Uncharacterized protein n=1 Tax=Coprinellus micaceus TaxID=71717 RepID=A0A4Y7T3N2_COPMI|nr:hypothetical protein FA13DRAFT_774310 [Coprinellus micaceus]
MGTQHEKWDSIRLARAGCRRWQSVLSALRLDRGSGVSMLSENAGCGPCAPISRRVALTASMNALPSFPPSSGLPPSTGSPLLIVGAPSPCDCQAPAFTNICIQRITRFSGP